MPPSGQIKMHVVGHNKVKNLPVEDNAYKTNCLLVPVHIHLYAQNTTTYTHAAINHITLQLQYTANLS